MKAAVLHDTARIPRFESFPDPVAQAGEVLVQVRAAALKPVDKQMADGSHYSAFREFPAVCGVDGVGQLENGSRVFFALPKSPYGAMAERTVVAQPRCFPLPDAVDDVTAAAIFNPGLSAWGALKWRAELAPGQSVLILGATGVTGQIAIQTAKLLGAGRIVAAGRDEKILATLSSLGADETLRIGHSLTDLKHDFARLAKERAFDVVIDYLWGAPAEALLSGLSREDFDAGSLRLRWVEVGESAGAAISLPAAALRSSRLEILGAGSGNAPTSPEMWVDAIQKLLANVASGAIRIDTEKVPLADVETAWSRKFPGRRVVLIP
ncbi:MAG TPA: zinc-binding alcohol dehydrogenase family protein [Candidatus Acidoferrales bacterium]|nr:zinc-binding alcohol dehydrogenase family protein [Candidatus Acidoferrales bacterium]